MRTIPVLALMLGACLPAPEGTFDDELYGPAFTLDAASPELRWRVDLAVSVPDLGAGHALRGDVTIVAQATQQTSRTTAGDGVIEAELSADPDGLDVLATASAPFSEPPDVGAWSLPAPGWLDTCEPGTRCDRSLHVRFAIADDASYDGDVAVRVHLWSTDPDVESAGASVNFIER